VARQTNANTRAHHADELIFRGWIELPAEVVTRAASQPLYRTTHRHLTARIKTAGITYLFREWSPETTRYLGEIVRGAKGIRVHLFRALAPDAPCRWVHQLGAAEMPIPNALG